MTEGEFHSIKMGGWSSLLEYECSLIKMKESEVVFLQQCLKAVRLHTGVREHESSQASYLNERWSVTELSVICTVAAGWGLTCQSCSCFL